MTKKSPNSFVSVKFEKLGVTLENLNEEYGELISNSQGTLKVQEQVRSKPYSCYNIVDAILDTEWQITQNRSYLDALQIIKAWDYIDIKTQVLIINLIRDGNNHLHDYEGTRVDYNEIVDKLLRAWPEANILIQKEEYNSACRNKADSILYYGVSFDEFSGGKEYDKLAIIGGKIVSLRSWNTTENYELTPELLNFLAKCAERQDLLLIEDAKEEDEPLLRYLSWQAECILKKELDIFLAHDPNEIDLARPSFQDIVDNVYNTLKSYYQMAKENDANGIGGYLTEEEKNELMSNISNNCGDDIVTCMISKYAILILSGRNLSVLYNEAREKGESDVEALIRAYRRLSSVRYRKTCGFFKKNDEAEQYVPPLTADPDFNRCLLKSIGTRGDKK